jgi:hypothetical protein
MQTAWVLFALTVRLGSVIALVDDQVLGTVVVGTVEVFGQDLLDTCRITFLGVDRGTRHVRNGGVAAAPGGVGGVTEWVVLGCWLWEPDITTVTAELAGFESVGNILLDNDGTTSGVDQPCA